MAEVCLFSPWGDGPLCEEKTDGFFPETCSPELYLRRPPARNAKYRLDNMLKAAAERGVMIYVIVYKEVAQALTRKLTSS